MDEAGMATIPYKLCEFLATIPTTGFNVEATPKKPSTLQSGTGDAFADSVIQDKALFRIRFTLPHKTSIKTQCFLVADA
jgi:hypothetical protein